MTGRPWPLELLADCGLIRVRRTPPKIQPIRTDRTGLKFARFFFIKVRRILIILLLFVSLK
jgi:hypothetical protein